MRLTRPFAIYREHVPVSLSQRPVPPCLPGLRVKKNTDSLGNRGDVQCFVA